MVSVIIVNYNRKDLLKECLDSVIGQSFKDIELIVVDNASSDGSIEMLGTYYPEIRLIRNAANLLFAKAQNQGIDASRGKFILCLNSDCILDKDYLKEALNAMGLDPVIGMVSGKILRKDGKTIDSTGLFIGRSRKAVERGYDRKDVGQYNEPGYVFGTSGACAFLRKSMLKGIKDRYGYFDERFGMYYEDLDLCWRAQKKGWKTYYNPKAVVYHARGGTAIGKKSEKGPRFLSLPEELKKRYVRNRYMCMKKNDSFAGIVLHLPFILCYDMGIRVLSFIKRKAKKK